MHWMATPCVVRGDERHRIQDANTPSEEPIKLHR